MSDYTEPRLDDLTPVQLEQYREVMAEQEAKPGFSRSLVRRGGNAGAAARATATARKSYAAAMAYSGPVQIIDAFYRLCGGKLGTAGRSRLWVVLVCNQGNISAAMWGNVRRGNTLGCGGTECECTGNTTKPRDAVKVKALAGGLIRKSGGGHCLTDLGIGTALKFRNEGWTWQRLQDEVFGMYAGALQNYCDLFKCSSCGTIVSTADSTQRKTRTCSRVCAMHVDPESVKQRRIVERERDKRNAIKPADSHHKRKRRENRRRLTDDLITGTSNSVQAFVSDFVSGPVYGSESEQRFRRLLSLDGHGIATEDAVAALTRREGEHICHVIPRARFGGTVRRELDQLGGLEVFREGAYKFIKTCNITHNHIESRLAEFGAWDFTNLYVGDGEENISESSQHNNRKWFYDGTHEPLIKRPKGRVIQFA